MSRMQAYTITSHATKKFATKELISVKKRGNSESLGT